MNSMVIVVLALVAAAQANVVHRKLKLEDRIVGGDEAVPNSIPFQAYLLMTAADGKMYQCGGSLLTPTTVLTAAHCVKGYVAILVYLGAHDINKYEDTQQRVQAISFVYHGGYDSKTIVNDIAIITLESPAEINEYVQLTRLPTRADVGESYVGRLATVSGWGRTSDDPGYTSNVLKHALSFVTPNAECQRQHSYLTPQQICMSGIKKEGACNGDSGGPLVFGSDNVQIGLVSYGSLAGCEKGYDVVYTRLTEYLDWIAANSGVVIN